MDGQCHLLYPESAGIHYFRCHNRKVKEHELFSLPSPIDVLSLQGIAVSYGDKNWSCPALMESLKSVCRLSLPEHFKENVVIGGVHFDYIFNMGNELKFLKVMNAVVQLADTRGVISLAFNRERFGELFHRGIVVLTDDSKLAERLRSEGGGKVGVVRVKYSYDHHIIEREKPCRNLIKHLLFTQQAAVSAPAPNPKTIKLAIPFKAIRDCM